MGPVLLSSVVDYRLVEPLNMQLPLKKSRHRPLTPRLEILRNGKRYASCYDIKAQISVPQEKDGIRIHVSSRPVSLEQEELSRPVRFHIDYWPVSYTHLDVYKRQNLDDEDEIIGMQLDSQGECLLIVSENGMGKRRCV